MPLRSQTSSRDTVNTLVQEDHHHRTGKYVAGGTALAVTLLGLHHLLLRGASPVAEVCIPAIIMVSYIIWVLYSARRDRRKALRLAMAMQLTEVISVPSRSTPDVICQAATSDNFGKNRSSHLYKSQNIRIVSGGGAQVKEGRKVTRAQTPTESTEDTARYGSEVPARASSSALPCSSIEVSDYLSSASHSGDTHIPRRSVHRRSHDSARHYNGRSSFDHRGSNISSSSLDLENRFPALALQVDLHLLTSLSLST